MAPPATTLAAASRTWSTKSLFTCCPPTRLELVAVRVQPVALHLHGHRAEELEVVVVGIGERGDPGPGCLPELVRLPDDRGTGSLEPLEVALDVGRLDVPDQPARLGVAARDLVVWADSDEARAELPPAVRAFIPAGRTEEPGVVVLQTLRICRPDQDAVQVHAVSPLMLPRPAGTPTRCRTAIVGEALIL